MIIRHQTERVFDGKEFMEISNRIAAHHGIFYTLWNLGKPYFTEDVPTAAVAFNKEGECIDFWMNPTFWDSLTQNQKDFVVCHEMLHVVLNHGIRGKNVPDKELANIAMDVVVNETLVRRFGFKRSEIDPDNHYCWQDQVFSKRKDVLEEQTFEYYMNLLNRMDPISLGNIGVLVDDHTELPDVADAPQKVIDAVKEALTDEEKGDLQERIKRQTSTDSEEDEDDESDDEVKGTKGKGGGGPAGNAFLGAMIPVSHAYVKPKRKWETIIKKWAAKFMKNEYRRKEQWLRVNRRLTSIPDAALLPTEMEEIDAKKKDRILVWLFLDTSGSCLGYAERFWKAARSLPEDRFDTRGCSFDTQVFDVNLKDPHSLRGGGGTKFHIIEERIQRALKEERKTNPNLQYPDAVFVITDGHGTPVKPEKPENWYWFLTSMSRGHDAYIHEKSQKFDLAKFE